MHLPLRENRDLPPGKFASRAEIVLEVGDYTLSNTSIIHFTLAINAKYFHRLAQKLLCGRTFPTDTLKRPSRGRQGR
jgi:hypothetical protein